MTDATDALDRRVIAHLRRIERRNEAAPTVAEITEALTTPMSSVRASLGRLLDSGDVTQVGVAANNARTWALIPRKETP